MPKGKYLSEKEKIEIDFYHKNKYSNRKIGRLINRSESVVRNFLKKGERYGLKKPTNGNRKLSKRQIGMIKHEATKNKLNATQIQRKHDLPVSKNHVSHILRSTPYIKWKKPLCKPSLKPHHITTRLEFARRHMQWTTQWNKIIFSDEKKFNLDGPDSMSCYWHDVRSNDVQMSKRNFGGGSVMVWAAFSVTGKAQICFVPPKMNSVMYNEMLEDVLITFMEEKMDDDCVFQQDNAAIHVSRVSLEWFSEHQICRLEWPACSPDLNPMENLWGIMVRRIYDQKPQNHSFRSVMELKLKIKEVWAEIDQEILQNLVNSMPNRIFELIQKNGKSINY